MREQHAWLNGISLEDVHPRLLLQHIEEGELQMDVRTGDRAGAPGLFVTEAKPKQRDIMITFAIRERLDFETRAAAVSAVSAWARSGGWLELSTRPGLRLWVTPTGFPDVGRPRDWTRDITLTLTAYAWPLWTETSPNTAALTGVTSGSAYVSAPGSWETVLEAEITPTSATLTSAEITVGSQTLTLTGLSVASGTALKIYWDERHLLHIEAGGVGLLGKRTGDDIILTPGRHEVEVTFSTACDVQLMARGCYL